MFFFNVFCILTPKWRHADNTIGTLCGVLSIPLAISSILWEEKTSSWMLTCWHADNTVVPTELCWNSVTACPISYLLPTSSSTHSWIQNAFAISRQSCISALKLCCNTPLKRQTTHFILTLWLKAQFSKLISHFPVSESHLASPVPHSLPYIT